MNRFGEEAPDQLSTVVRDAIDQTTEIVRDAVSLGTLEAKRAICDVGPRLAWGAVAVLFGSVGVVLAIIAVFIGLGAIIPSAGWRLALFSLLFCGVAAVGVSRVVARPRRKLEIEHGDEEPPTLPRAMTPLHPVDGIGE